MLGSEGGKTQKIAGLQIGAKSGLRSKKDPKVFVVPADQDNTK
jgi:hypothetical protein